MNATASNVTAFNLSQLINDSSTLTGLLGTTPAAAGVSGLLSGLLVRCTCGTAPEMRCTLTPLHALHAYCLCTAHVPPLLPVTVLPAHACGVRKCALTACVAALFF